MRTYALFDGRLSKLADDNPISMAHFAFLKLDTLGRIYTLLGKEDLLLRRSFDGGATFDAPQTILPSGNGWLLSGDEIASTGGDGIVDVASPLTIDELLGGTTSGRVEVVYSRSTDAGAHFSEPDLISQFDDSDSYAPSIARAGHLVGIVWQDTAPNDSIGSPTILFRRSLDSGDTFAPAIAPSDVPMQGWDPKIAIPDSQTIYVVWSDLQGSVFTRSTNAGESFDAPVRLPFVAYVLPQIVVEPDGSVNVIGEERHTFYGNRLYVTRSIDGGLSFSQTVELAVPSEDSVCASARMSPSGQFAVGWTTEPRVMWPLLRMTTGRASYFAVSDQNGNFGAPVQIPVINDSEGCPTVTFDPVEPTTLHLTWGGWYSKATLTAN